MHFAKDVLWFVHLCLRFKRQAVKSEALRLGVTGMRVIKFIVRVTILTGAILLLLSNTAA